MHPFHERLLRSRRDFLTSTASGVGLVALASLLREQGLLADEAVAVNPLAPKPPHFAAKAKNCICIYLEGAPSQLDLFDPKPELNKLNGQKLPDSMTEKVRFAFIQKESARLLGSPRTFKKYGQCGMDLSDFLPHLGECVDDIALIRSMHTEAFNHHPGQLMMNTGVATFGRPSMGSWLTYGLGSESKEPAGLRRADGRPRRQRRRFQLVERFSAHHLPGRPLPQPGRSGAGPRQPRRPQRSNGAQNDPGHR